MGNWEVGGAYLGEIVGPHWMVGFPEKDSGVEAFRRRKRGSSGHTTVSAGMGLEGMLRLRGILENGGRMVVLVDRSVGRDSVRGDLPWQEVKLSQEPRRILNLDGRAYRSRGDHV